MRKVITYGTYDLLHRGHIRLLERARMLGDYLVVGVTSEDFDKTRGKINIQQSLVERIESVRATGLADEIVVEEYEGQKIDDICRMDIDIFVLGSDWKGKFDYLKEYCEVVYLERTEGISSTQLRGENNPIRFGLCGRANYLNKVARETKYVNGMILCALCSGDTSMLASFCGELPYNGEDYADFLNKVDAVYIHSTPDAHYDEIREALNQKKHVICESPISTSYQETKELFRLAKVNGCVLQEAIKTAYQTAYSRMMLLIKSGKIGEVVSVEATCTSLSRETDAEGWNSIETWGPVALLPVFQIYGTSYVKADIVSIFRDGEDEQELMTSIQLLYPKGVASIKVGKGIKSEGELIISGTKGYIYVPAPWWKTEYFELRYEDLTHTRKYFYQLDGEGIRNELVSFSRKIKGRNNVRYIDEKVSCAISGIMDRFLRGENTIRINLEDEDESI